MRWSRSKTWSVMAAMGGLVLATAVASPASSSPVPASGLTASHDVHWSYSGDTGPEHWGSLSPDWAACADGSAQSPIDLGKTTPKPMTNLAFRYLPLRAVVVDNGHTIETVPASEVATNRLLLGSQSYDLLQFHYHAPSEHTINGKTYPLEFHFVHKSSDGTLAVVGVFVKKGPAAGPAWQAIIRRLAASDSESSSGVVRNLNWNSLLPTNQQTIRYAGSLTTPGCAEGVKWNVMNHAITMSAAQIKQFTDQYSGNVRPVQPINGRNIHLDSSKNK